MQKVTLKLIVILFLSLFMAKTILAQVGGSNTYDFLNLTNSARIASMGGNILSIADGDITLAIANPSLIDSSMDYNLAMSIVDYYSDINYGFAAYAMSFAKIGSIVGSIQFVDYGKFNYADETGYLNGKFGASELAMQLGWSKSLNAKWIFGVNLKYIHSVFEGYNSFGISTDLAGSFIDHDKGFSSSLIIKNLGWQIKSYRSSNHETFPFELQFAMSKKLKHIPFRYSVVIGHLNKWDVSDENQYFITDPDFVNESGAGELKFADQLFRHIIIGGELLLSQNFIVRMGYNYQRRKELGLETRMSTVGFSWGFEIKISRFRLSYARTNYHLAGSPNYFTIMTNLSEFFKK